LKLSGKTVDPAQAGIQLRPEFPGVWRWRDDRTLVFTPQADWPIDQHYRVTLVTRGFAAPQVHLARHAFEFETASFTATIEANQFYEDPVVATDKRILTTLNFTHPVDSRTLEPRIHLRLYNKVAEKQEQELPRPAFTVTYDKLRLHAYIHSEALSVPAKQGRVEVEIKSGVAALRGGNRSPAVLQDSVTVPGLYSLNVSGARITIVRDQRDTPSQALIMESSHSVTEREMTARVHAWVLPLRHPDPTVQAEWELGAGPEPYRWSMDLVSPAVLAQSTPLPLSYVPNERDQVELHSFALKAEPHRQIYVQVDQGLQSFGGYRLADPFATLLSVPEYPKEVHIAYQGSLLAYSGHRKITLFTRDVPALRVQVGRLLPGQLQHLITQSYGDFSNPSFARFGFDDANVTERYINIVPMPALEAGAPNYQAFDLGEYLAKPGASRQGIFLLRIEAYDPKTQQVLSGQSYGEHVADTRLVVVTDLGLLAKQGVDGGHDVFVQSIATGDPVATVTVDVIGRNGEPVLTRSTDGSGHVHFPELRSFKDEREPVLFLAHRGTDSSFLPIKSHLQPLDLSRFDVGGVSNRAERSALSAYLFSDRGIYRPGDEIRAAAIIKTQDWQALPAGLPLRVEITDPRGVAVKRETIKLSAEGLEPIVYRTRDSAAVGSYTINIYVIQNENYEGQRLLGSMNVKVQEFLPDRLRLHTHFSNELNEGWVAPEKLQALVELENLFGTPAQNRQVQASMQLSPAVPRFARYADYTFLDPQTARDGFSETLTDQKTDATGHATFDLNLGRFARATYRVKLTVQGYEADGGRAVSGEAAQLVSNQPFLVGWKADGKLDYVQRTSGRTIYLIAIDPHLSRTAGTGLTLQRFERRYVSVLLREPSGVYKYESRLKEIPLETRAFELPPDGSELKLDSTTAGDFSYLLKDNDGQIYAQVDYSVAGAANLSRSLEKNAELQIALNKHDYTRGETIEMQIQAPYVGAGLITIERDRVYAWQWFKTSTTGSVQKIQVPEDLEGNAYVSVSFVRDPSSEEIYTSPLSYGVQPFSIALDARSNAVELQLPRQIKPGETLQLGYRAAHPARIALFAVDEGILQVARYRTPDPLGFFFQKRALEVHTRQILDLILPEFRASMLSAPGGDEGSRRLAANLNPFKRKTDRPVAFWAGIVEVGPEQRQLSWSIPDYFNGTLHVMAVAVNDESIGTADQTLLVRGDFVLSPNAPLTVTPGDEFEVSVGVSNNVAASGPQAAVMVALRPSEYFEALSPMTVMVPIAEMSEGSARFRLRARDQLGSARLTFGATLGQHGATLATEISLRPATPYMSTLLAGSFHHSTTVPVSRNMYPQFRTLSASVSSLPLTLAHGLAAYLGHYPYSCTEQLVSQAMPAIVLEHRPELGDVRSDGQSTLATLIDELRARQNPDGSYRYWPGGVESIAFVSVYAQHVLLEAQERGQSVPQDLIASGNRYLERVARRDGDTLDDERTSAYAIYLLARQGNVVSGPAAALQLRLQQRYRKIWPSDIAAAYLAAAYHLMRQQELADQLISGVSFGTGERGERWHNPMSRDAELLYLLARHFPERLARLPDSVLDGLAQDVQAREYQSLSAADTILALDAYASAAAPEKSAQLSISAELADGSKQALALPPASLFPKTAFPEQARRLTLGNGSELRAFYSIVLAGFDRTPPTEVITQGLEITREYLDASGQAVSHVKRGGELTVHLRFRGIGRPRIDDAVLVDLLPGGFDLVVPRTPPTEQVMRTVSIGNPARTGFENDRGCVCSFLISRPQGFPDFADVREDRVVLYGRATDSVQEFSYRIKATNVGNYAVPSAYGESMYDSQVRARSLPARIVVDP
jgi:uncharacterized protein YfaS (alpha-2-macroglobulin family)